jgi:hypothetical protein
MIFICVLDTEVNTTNVYLQKMTAQLRELVNNNFDGFDLHTEYKVEALRRDITFENQMKQISKVLADSTLHD